MSVEQNKNVLRRLYSEVYTQGKINVLSELVSEDCVDHNPMPNQPPGLKGIRQAVETIRRGFPDLQLTPGAIMADGEQVHGRFIARGTHRGEYMGYSPTNKRIEMTGMDTVTVRNGKIVDWYHNEDMVPFLQQVGAIDVGVRPDGGERVAQQPSGGRPPRTRA